MANIKPLLYICTIVFLVAIFLEIVVSPFVDTSEPNNESLLYYASDFVENGVSLNFTIPIFGTLDFGFSPVTWLWLGIDSVTEIFVDYINLLTYVPDVVTIPLMIITILIFGFTIVTLVRGN